MNCKPTIKYKNTTIDNHHGNGPVFICRNKSTINILLYAYIYQLLSIKFNKMLFRSINNLIALSIIFDVHKRKSMIILKMETLNSMSSRWHKFQCALYFPIPGRLILDIRYRIIHSMLSDRFRLMSSQPTTAHLTLDLGQNHYFIIIIILFRQKPANQYSKCARSSRIRHVVQMTYAHSW